MIYADDTKSLLIHLSQATGQFSGIKINEMSCLIGLTLDLKWSIVLLDRHTNFLFFFLYLF